MLHEALLGEQFTDVRHSMSFSHTRGTPCNVRRRIIARTQQWRNQPMRETLLLIDNQWRPGSGNQRLSVQNPATGALLGTVACAETADLDDALASVQRGFEIWRKTSAFERYRILRRAADMVRSNAAVIGATITEEQGKTLVESAGEMALSAEVMDWLAEEARRTYGRIVPGRAEGVVQSVVKEPVGPVAAFSPWNYPVNQAVRKISAALAAGCSIILKGPEEAPASVGLVVQAYLDAGVPAGVINLVFGRPAEISAYLIANQVIRKVTFTGSTRVGKELASMAGQFMKRATMELGGHAPAIVCEGTDPDAVVKMLCAAKFRNAGQICTSPTRALVHSSIFESFVRAASTYAEKLCVGNGADSGTQMGPLVAARRVEAMQALVQDAVDRGACVRAGGYRLEGGNHVKGHFFAPTVLVDTPLDARLMNEEPFGPVQ
jgi:succinate-semialdehyde dehydrogenase/glutarate-semialdehyde dehydrogenase